MLSAVLSRIRKRTNNHLELLDEHGGSNAVSSRKRIYYLNIYRFVSYISVVCLWKLLIVLSSFFKWWTFDFLMFVLKTWCFFKALKGKYDIFIILSCDYKINNIFKYIQSKILLTLSSSNSLDISNILQFISPSIIADY